jgi:hypothetical protein
MRSLKFIAELKTASVCKEDRIVQLGDIVQSFIRRISGLEDLNKEKDAEVLRCEGFAGSRA